MKRTITHLLLLLFLSLSSSVMAADDVVTVNGVKYQGLTDDSGKNVVAAKVVGADPQKDGILTIAESVTVNGKKLSVTNIGDSTFCSREDICQVEFPSSLKKIGNFAFSSCTNLKSISLPDNVETLGESAFRDCVRLESVVFSEKITMIPTGCFSGCMSLKELNLPSNLKEICSYSFSTCESLTEVVVPEKVEKIHLEAFNGCSRLTKVTIPASVADIGYYAFGDCPNLKTIIVLNPQPPTMHNIIDSYAEWGSANPIDGGDYSSTTLIVPSGSEDAYKDSDWGQFKNITNGINPVSLDDNSEIKGIFDIHGRKMDSLKAGINIIVLANGNIKKVIR